MTKKDLNNETVEENSATEEAFVEDVKKDEENNELNQENEIQLLVKENEELKAKIEEAENRILRLQADYENSRRRAKLDLAATEKYKSQSLITGLLPAIDNFERALQIEADNEQTKSVLQGVEMVYRSLLDALKAEGAEQIEAVGKEFDPNLHQAIMQVEDANFDSNIVVEELQKGYILKDRVIRPSMVKVNQ
ncbi:MAG: nucleotide exchange factor GrpE [Bacillus sp. (in: firmicutes)]